MHGPINVKRDFFLTYTAFVDSVLEYLESLFPVRYNPIVGIMYTCLFTAVTNCDDITQRET
jgi:hypothetical protein